MLEKHPDRDELFFHVTKPKVVMQYIVPVFLGLMYAVEVLKWVTDQLKYSKYQFNY